MASKIGWRPTMNWLIGPSTSCARGLTLGSLASLLLAVLSDDKGRWLTGAGAEARFCASRHPHPARRVGATLADAARVTSALPSLLAGPLLAGPGRCHQARAGPTGPSSTTGLLALGQPGHLGARLGGWPRGLSAYVAPSGLASPAGWSQRGTAFDRSSALRAGGPVPDRGAGRKRASRPGSTRRSAGGPLALSESPLAAASMEARASRTRATTSGRLSATVYLVPSTNVRTVPGVASPRSMRSGSSAICWPSSPDKQIICSAPVGASARSSSIGCSG